MNDFRSKAVVSIVALSFVFCTFVPAVCSVERGDFYQAGGSEQITIGDEQIIKAKKLKSDDGRSDISLWESIINWFNHFLGHLVDNPVINRIYDLFNAKNKYISSDGVDESNIWTTDKDGIPKYDFAPGDIVYIHGTGFLSWRDVDIDITRPNCVVDSGSTTINLTGGFVYEYDLDGILGFYFVVASDGINSAQIIFTDNHGAIWTTRGDCGDVTQDVNLYDIGDHVYINGKGFTPEVEYEWFIKGKPGGASCHPNEIVASGQVIANESGAFCFYAYEVRGDDCGEYSVKVDSKNDNYRVNAPWPDEPNVDIEKQVWNAITLSWMDSITATVGTILSFRINVMNTGNVDLTNVIVVDDLPSFLSYNDGTATPPPFTSSDHQIIWDLGTLTVGSCQLLTFNATVDTCGFGDNVANVTTDNGVYDEDYVSVEGLPIPSVDVEKKIWDPDTQSWVESIDASAGSTVRFNISIHNDGICSGLMGITVIDMLPPSLEYSNDATPSEPDDITGKQLTWSFPGPFLVGNWIYIEFNATVLYCGELDINVVNVSAQCMITSETVYDEDTASVFGQPISSIDIEKKIWDSDTMSWVEPIYTPVGNTVRFNISVHNDGICSDLTNINVTDFLPPSLEYANSATPFEPIIWAGGKHLTWEFAGPFLVGNWIYIEFNATVAFVGEGINVVNVSATGSTVYDEDTASVFGLANSGIEVTKTADPTSGAPSTNVDFTITVDNTGDCDLDPVIVVDTLPAGMSYVSDDSGGIEGPAGVITWDLGLISPADPPVVITLVAHIDPGASGTLHNVVDVTGTPPYGDDVTDDDFADVTISYGDIEIDKMVWDPDPAWRDQLFIPLGATRTFKITITNTGIWNLTNIYITDTMSSQLIYRNAANYGEYYISPDFHNVIWHFDYLDIGESKTITFDAKAVHTSYGWNKANVTTDQGATAVDIVPIKVYIDRDPPICQLIYPEEGEFLSGTETVRWYAIDDDPDSEVLQIYLYYSPIGINNYHRIAGPLFNNIDIKHGSYNWDTSRLSNGEYKLLVEVVGSGGICHDSAEITIAGGSYDMAIDVIIQDISIDSTSYVKDGDTVRITATITGYGSSKLTKGDITADLSDFGFGMSTADSYNGFEAVWTVENLNSLDDGEITITVNANDVTGSDTIIVDNTDPELTVEKPLNGLYFLNTRLIPLARTIIIGSITIELETDDNNGIDRAEFCIDDELMETDTEGSFEWYTNLPRGQHRLELRVYDNAGNKATQSVDFLKLL